jgi:hypothetical protein
MCLKIQNGVYVELLFGRIYMSCFSGRGGILGNVSQKGWSGAESPEGLGGGMISRTSLIPHEF